MIDLVQKGDQLRHSYQKVTLWRDVTKMEAPLGASPASTLNKWYWGNSTTSIDLTRKTRGVLLVPQDQDCIVRPIGRASVACHCQLKVK